MEEKILEGNKLIAQFMGSVKDNARFASGKSIEFTDGKFVDYDAMGKGYLKYDSSWDQLMPVVEKIEATQINSEDYPTRVLIDHKWCSIDTQDFWWEPKNPPVSKIEAVWLACIQFIQWFNQNLYERSKPA